MIHVKVKLFAILKKYAPSGESSGTPFVMELPDSSSLRDVAARLGMPEGEVRIAFVNGIIQQSDCPLKENDEVGMFPPIGGG